MEYVVGFLIDRVSREVALVRKNRPDWQAGKCNGIGGKIEPNESPDEAMAREFEEEAGHSRTDWERFCVLVGGEPWSRSDGFQVHFFRAFASNLHDLVFTKTDEFIVVSPLDDLPEHVPNLDWLLPMAMNKEADSANWFIVREMYA